jgi:hypothetical protein
LKETYNEKRADTSKYYVCGREWLKDISKRLEL